MKSLLESINFTLDQINNPRFIYKNIYQEMIDIQLNYNNQYCPVIFEDNSIDYDTDCLYEVLDMIFESELSDSDKISYLNIIVEKTLGQKVNNFIANKGIQKHFNSLSGKQSGFGGKVLNNLKNRLIDTHKVVNDTNDGPKTKKEWIKAVGHDFIGVHKKQGLYDQKYKDYINPMNSDIKNHLKVSHILHKTSAKNLSRANDHINVADKLSKKYLNINKNIKKTKEVNPESKTLDFFRNQAKKIKEKGLYHINQSRLGLSLSNSQKESANSIHNNAINMASSDEYKNRLDKAKQIYWEKNNIKPDILGKASK